MKNISALSMAALLAGSLMSYPTFAASQTADETYQLLEQQKKNTYYKVSYRSEEEGAKIAISYHAELMETNKEQRYHVIDLTTEDIAKLESLGLTVDIATDFMNQQAELLTQMQSVAVQTTLTTNSENNTAALIAGIPGYSCYETVEETFAAAQTIANTYTNLADWIDVGNSWEKNQGLGGFDIKVLKLTNKANTGTKPILFVNSAIHAREYTTAPLNLAFANWLVEGYGNNADATWILDHHEVHLMLQTNPDGRKKAETGLSWRKNANQNYCGSTSNSRGADLNRNFSFSWNITNGQGSSGNQCDATYRGPSPASEPEVQAIEAYVRSIFPDRRGPNKNDAAPADTTGIHIDVHSYSELVLWPWGDTNQVAPNGIAMQTLGRKFAFFNNYRPQQSIGLYPTDGTSDAVSYGELGVPAYTFELGTSFFQGCSTFESTIKPDNLQALIYAAKVVGAPYITPGGPDVTNLALSDGASSGGVTPGTPVTLTATTSDTRFNNSNGTEPTQNIVDAEYYIDVAPWQSGSTAIALSAADGSFNSKTEGVTGVINTTGLSLGRHIVYVRAKDADGVWGAVTAEFLVIDNDPTPEPVEYCAAAGANASEEWISQITVGSFTNASGSATYSDFTSKTVPVSTGANAITLTPGFSGSSYNEHWTIWIDLNADGDFSDSGEEVYNSGTASSSTRTGTLTVPAGTAEGDTRMRVAMRYNAAPSACGTFNYGEVEDYTVQISDGGGTVPSTFENTNSYAIPDNDATGVSSPIAVNRTGASGTVSVAVNISHTYKGDLIVDVIHPDGTVYNLHNRTGGSANDIIGSFSVDAGSKDSSGTWNLRVRDRARADVGTINQWSLTFQ
ncbi:MAG: M14 family zinc carboxypeptidase [Reinekea sp.]|nr:M14 family zinc carboxypeptidase [Reinekea sp.]